MVSSYLEHGNEQQRRSRSSRGSSTGMEQQRCCSPESSRDGCQRSGSDTSTDTEKACSSCHARSRVARFAAGSRKPEQCTKASQESFGRSRLGCQKASRHSFKSQLGRTVATAQGVQGTTRSFVGSHPQWFLGQVCAQSARTIQALSQADTSDVQEESDHQ